MSLNAPEFNRYKVTPLHRDRQFRLGLCFCRPIRQIRGEIFEVIVAYLIASLLKMDSNSLKNAGLISRAHILLEFTASSTRKNLKINFKAIIGESAMKHTLEHETNQRFWYEPVFLTQRKRRDEVSMPPSLLRRQNQIRSADSK